MASEIVIATGEFPSADNLQYWLRLLTQVDVRQMRAGRYRRLYESGVRYRREARRKDGTRKEVWRATRVLYRRRFGDCEDLACSLAAEYQVRGIGARAVAVRSGRGWHIVVKMPDGSTEDPSARLGMGGS